jgi:hypothetical protein
MESTESTEKIQLFFGFFFVVSVHSVVIKDLTLQVLLAFAGLAVSLHPRHRGG